MNVSDNDNDDNMEQQITLREGLRPVRSNWKEKYANLALQWKHYSFNISVKRMIEQYGDNGKESILKELNQLFKEKNVFVPIKDEEIVDRSEIRLKKTPTDEMVSDGLTKQLYGTKFKSFVRDILNNEH